MKKGTIQKSLLFGIIGILILIGIGIGVSFSNSLSYDETLLKDSNAVLQQNKAGFINNNYEVKFEQGNYEVYLNNELVQKIQEQNNDLIPNSKKSKEPSQEALKVFSISKEKIYKYIDQSKILRDKPDLKRIINETKIKELLEGEICLFSDEDQTVYYNPSVLCEWVIIHELVHALSDATAGGLKNKEYQCSLFDEIITDLITSSMGPKFMKGNFETGYTRYYNFGYIFIGIYKWKALEGYFYGYDYNLFDKTELDFYTLCLQMLEKNPDANLYATMFLSKNYFLNLNLN